MLNPETNNFVIEFGNKFYHEKLIEKYNNFLYHKNNPVKDIKNHIHESIETLSVPGLNLGVVEVNGIKNFKSPQENRQTTSNWVFPKNQSLLEAFEINKLNIVCKNTLINWTYFYEFFRFYIKRGKKDQELNLEDFKISVIVQDSANIPILMFTFKNCFSASLPALDFSYGSPYNESKTIDVGFWFNEMDINLLIPNYDLKNLNHG